MHKLQYQIYTCTYYDVDDDDDDDGGDGDGVDVDNKNNIEGVQKMREFSARQSPNNGKQPLQQNCSSWTVPFPLVRRTFCVPLFGSDRGSIFPLFLSRSLALSFFV